MTAFYQTKDWYKSKTIWAGIVTTVTGLLGLLGIYPELDTNALVEAIVTLSGLTAIYGRVTATKEIGDK